MQQFEARVIYSPSDPALRFLPEGPCDAGGGRISWVAIQHGAELALGSLNVLDLATGSNQSFPLPGRPGFAFPTDREGLFVVGLERRLILFDTLNGSVRELCSGIDADVDGTIINDGLAFDDGLLFGTKDLEFRSPKAGLYFWRRRDARLFRLRSDQICSNGKVLLHRDGVWRLLDIDSPAKTVVAYELDVEAGSLGPPRVVVDLREDPAFPDGMVLAPDGRSVVVAFYHPGDPSVGEARQYRLEDGRCECVWTTPAAPQVTCPLLIEWEGGVRLVLTTAVEHMAADRLARHVQSGSLFLADTPFPALGEAVAYRWPVP